MTVLKNSLVNLNMKSVILFLLVVAALHSQDRYYYFHPEQEYGTELSFNPGSVCMNGTFDILRNGAHSKNMLDQPYVAGMENVWRNVSHPIKNVDQYGWKNFVSQEIVPLSLNKDKSRYIPNYMHHVLGSGMIYKKMAEWYDYHKVPYPHLASALTSMFYHFMNETLENGGYQGSNTDPIADLLFFDPLGMLLFSFDSVNHLFSDRLILEDWSLQPVYNPQTQAIDNAGQQFVLKYKLPYFDHLSLFTYWGINGISGLSYSFENGNNVSFGIGQVVNKLNPKLLRDSRYMTPELDGAIGLFYDRNHSLLFSVIITGPRMYNVRMNAYPGFLNWKWFHPGLYLGVGEWDHLICGITLAHVPLGVSAGGKH